MLDEISNERYANMTQRELRWLENIKKAFYNSDLAYKNDDLENTGLEALLKGIDIAETLGASLREDQETFSSTANKKRYLNFLAAEIPAARADGMRVELYDRISKSNKTFHLGELIYAIRCSMVHENENLNAAEQVDFHVLLDWSSRDRHVPSVLCEGTMYLNGYFLWLRLREMLAGFITGAEAMRSMALGASSFSVTAQPPLCSIKPQNL